MENGAAAENTRLHRQRLDRSDSAGFFLLQFLIWRATLFDSGGQNLKFKKRKTLFWMLILVNLKVIT